MSKTESEPSLSDLEAWILETIDNIGWYAYLWFPVISREVLNFPCDKSDEEVYAAFSGLIRKGALKMVPSSPSAYWSVLEKCLTPPTLSERRFFANYTDSGLSRN